jgi:hypothetical protein
MRRRFRAITVPVTTEKHIFLSVLFFQEPETPDVWIAQALEHDIAAYGPDVASATRAFVKTLSGYIALAAKHHREPFAGVRPAPDEFWTVWRRIVAGHAPAIEPLTALPAFMIPAVSHEPLSTTH